MLLFPWLTLLFIAAVIGLTNGSNILLSDPDPTGYQLKWIAGPFKRYASGSDPALNLNETVVYVVEGCLLALDPQGKVKWQTSPPGNCLADAVSAVDSQRIYGGVGSVFIMAVHPDGSAAWTRQLSGFPSMFAADGEGTLYLSLWDWGSNQKLVALNAQDGTPKWGPLRLIDYIEKPQTTFEIVDVSPPVILPDDTLLVAALLAELDLPSNELIHSLLLYRFSKEGHLQRVSRTDISRGAWKRFPVFPYFAQRAAASPIVGSDGTIYLVTNSRSRILTLYALDPEGALLWSLEIEDESLRREPILGADGTVYLGAYHALYAISPEGQLKWSFRLPRSSPKGYEYVSGAPTVGADGVIYLPTSIGPPNEDAGTLYALDSEGNLLWTFETVGEILSSPTLSRDRTLYFTTMGPCNRDRRECEGRVYALQTNSPGLAASPWPMYRGDPQHSGRVKLPRP